MEQREQAVDIREISERFREKTAEKENYEVQTVRLLGQDIDVEYVKGLEDYGNFEQKNATIFIDSELTLQPMQDTLLHEIMHAILQAYEKDTEVLVRILTPALLGLLKDNPHLIKFLTQTGRR
jgi:Zn-dependent peptidase ImmA (M78 family)